MNLEELAKEANNKIIEWVKDGPKLVIAIDGYTGVGKTSFLNELVKINPDILPVHRDDFLVSRVEHERLLKGAKDRSVVFELFNIRNDELEHLVRMFKEGVSTYTTKVFNEKTGEIDIEKSFDLSKKIMVIEGVFMFHPKLLNHLWDKRVYLDGDMNSIDERRIKREKERWGEEYFPETHPDSYFRQVIIALRRYREEFHPEKMADIVLEVR